MDEKENKFEVVSGNGSDLNISPVYTHIEAEKPKSETEKPKNIIVPKASLKNKKSKKDKKKKK